MNASSSHGGLNPSLAPDAYVSNNSEDAASIWVAVELYFPRAWHQHVYFTELSDEGG